MTHRARACLMRQISRTGRLLAACALALGALGALATAAPAASAAATASTSGWLRLANLSPGAPTFDIYLYAVGSTDARLVLRGISYGMVSGYQVIPAGSYTVATRMAGQPASSAPALSSTVAVSAGHAYTMASTGPSSDPRLELLSDQLTTPKGRAVVRIIQASLHESQVTVTASGHVLARDLAFGSATTYATVPPGHWNVRAAGRTMSATARDAWTAGTSYTLVVLDGAGHLELECLTDGSGSKAMPGGGAEMGFGGTALRPGPSSLRWLAGMTGGALIAACGGLWLRRTRAAA